MSNIFDGITDEGILEKAKEIEKKRLEESKEKTKNIEDRLKTAWTNGNIKVFKMDELRFAAYKRCQCGAGLAYPKGGPVFGSWDCSAILLGNADLTMKHSSYSFSMYKIKSESQPSANGATTRPMEGEG